MKQIGKAAILMLLIMLAFGSANAIASGPLFLTESKKALLVTIDGGTTTLRGDHGGGEGTISCRQYKAHGFILDKSPLAHELHVELSGKCELELVGSKFECQEPIKFVLSYGELGLLNEHVYLLLAPESGTKFFTYTCFGGNTEFERAVIGEFKLNDQDGIKQYGVDRKGFLLLYKAKGTTQEPEEIELLGTLMKGVTLECAGLFGEKCSLESIQFLLVDGNALIDP